MGLELLLAWNRRSSVSLNFMDDRFGLPSTVRISRAKICSTYAVQLCLAALMASIWLYVTLQYGTVQYKGR
jgi:hypothetical protein